MAFRAPPGTPSPGRGARAPDGALPRVANPGRPGGGRGQPLGSRRGRPTRCGKGNPFLTNDSLVVLVRAGARIVQQGTDDLRGRPKIHCLLTCLAPTSLHNSLSACSCRADRVQPPPSEERAAGRPPRMPFHGGSVCRPNLARDSQSCSPRGQPPRERFGKLSSRQRRWQLSERELTPWPGTAPTSRKTWPGPAIPSTGPSLGTVLATSPDLSSHAQAGFVRLSPLAPPWGRAIANACPGRTGTRAAGAQPVPRASGGVLLVRLVGI
jgi:hypothetical protein